MRTLTPSIHVAPSVKTITAFCHLHQLAEVDFVNDFHLERTFVLDKKAFISTLTRFPCLSSGGLRIWCMNFYKITLSLTTLLVVLIFFKKYMGTLFMVMFFH